MKPETLKSKRLHAILYFIILVLLLSTIYVWSPSLFNLIYQTFRYFLITLTILFIFLTLLVLIGLRDQAIEIIKRVIDGSLTSIDVYEGIKRVIKKIIKKIKNLFIKLIPLYALIISIYLYFFIIFLFKYVGTLFDVTIFTAVLTFTLFMFSAFLTRPKGKRDFDKVKDNFIANFTDFFEITLFIFFLTIDSEHLFFLPDHLNTELTSKIGDYDLMIRGINIYDHFNTTLNIILFIFIVEIVRNSLGFYLIARKYAHKLEEENYNGSESILKLSIKQSLYGNMDDIIKFITYITFVVFVFLFFPRLKLLALAITSIAALVADFIFPERLTATTEKKQDLLGKVLTRIFRLNK